jgi:TetR/AcrR family transcriptional regulator, transcriptional repressor for nem operon
VRRSMARLAELMPSRGERRREDDALAFMATLLGTIVLARAVDNQELSDRILKVGRSRATKGD